MADLAEHNRDWLRRTFAILKAAASEVPFASTAVAIVDAVCTEIGEARTQRATRRLTTVIDTLSHRVAHLEADFADKVEPERIDLFFEFMERSVTDEDNAKSDLYAAFMAWTLTSNVNLLKARLLGNAIQALSHYEMSLFVYVVRHGGNFPALTELERNLFWNRVEVWGLSSGGVKYNGSPTEFGKILCDLWPPATKKPPA